MSDLQRYIAKRKATDPAFAAGIEGSRSVVDLKAQRGPDAAHEPRHDLSQVLDANFRHEQA